jgi:hypothetical protein
MLAGAWFFIDSRFAHAEVVAGGFVQQQIMVQERIIQQDIRSLNAQKDWLKGRGVQSPADQHYLDYLDLQLEQRYLDQKELIDLRTLPE